MYVCTVCMFCVYICEEDIKTMKRKNAKYYKCESMMDLFQMNGINVELENRVANTVYAGIYNCLAPI